MKTFSKSLFIILCLGLSVVFGGNVSAKSVGKLNSSWSVFPSGCSAETYIAAVALNYVKGRGEISCWDIENMTSDYSDCFKKSGVEKVRCFLNKLGVSNSRGVEGGLQPVKSKTTCENVMRVTARIIAGQYALVSKGSKHALITKVSATKKNGKWSDFKFHGVIVSGTSTSKSGTGSGSATKFMKAAEKARAALTYVGNAGTVPSYGNICGK